MITSQINGKIEDVVNGHSLDTLRRCREVLKVVAHLRELISTLGGPDTI